MYIMKMKNITHKRYYLLNRTMVYMYTLIWLYSPSKVQIGVFIEQKKWYIYTQIWLYSRSNVRIGVTHF